MRKTILAVFATGTMVAQTVAGPVLGYVVDSEKKLRPVYGLAGSAHVGEATREGVRDAWGTLALLADGTALRNGAALEGRWASVQPGAFLDESGQEVLVAEGGVDAWRLKLPERALAVRVSSSGRRVLTLLADESLAAWTVDGKAEFRLPASQWWSMTFAGERALAYDPAAHSLLWLDGPGGTTLARKLDGEGGKYELAVDQAGRFAVLRGEQILLAPMDGGEVRSLAAPSGAERLETMQGGQAFLLTRDPARPLWILAPEREDPLLVVPALAARTGEQR